MKEKSIILDKNLQPKQATLDFLKNYSAQFFSINSKQIGIVILSNN